MPVTIPTWEIPAKLGLVQSDEDQVPGPRVAPVPEPRTVQQVQVHGKVFGHAPGVTPPPTVPERGEVPVMIVTRAAAVQDRLRVATADRERPRDEVGAVIAKPIVRAE